LLVEVAVTPTAHRPPPGMAVMAAKPLSDPAAKLGLGTTDQMPLMPCNTSGSWLSVAELLRHDPATQVSAESFCAAISALAARQVRQNWNVVWPLMSKGANLLVVICLALTVAASERNIRAGAIDLGSSWSQSGPSGSLWCAATASAPASCHSSARTIWPFTSHATPKAAMATASGMKMLIFL
jgi:hypothetical protein